MSFSAFKRRFVNIVPKDFVKHPVKYDDLVAEECNLVGFRAFVLMTAPHREKTPATDGKYKNTQTLEMLNISRSAKADLDSALSGFPFALAHMPSRLRVMERRVSRVWESTGDFLGEVASHWTMEVVVETEVRRRKTISRYVRGER